MRDWQPTASIETLRKRAAFFSSIRDFFKQRQVLEVDTPALAVSTVTDVHLEALETHWQSPERLSPHNLFLQTSPEYFMKRLLAAGSGDIYYLGKCYRNDESGRFHNPEFTMLEWYRCGFDMQNLIDEVSQLITFLLGVEVTQLTYRQAFKNILHFDPLTLSPDEVDDVARQYSLSDYLRNYSAKGLELSKRDALLQVLFSQHIEAQVSMDCAVIVSHFPASQASLAKLSEDRITAERFELYWQGVELANGFAELTDYQQQAQRFEQDNAIRAALGKPQKPVDDCFLAAIESGLPECAGVALGVDRLLMLGLNKIAIDDVMPFTLKKSMYANR